MKRKAITLGLAGLTGLALFGAILSGTRHVPARADANNYTNQRRQIRACVLISSAAQDVDNRASVGAYPSNTLPYVFYAMDKGNDLKPAGLEFVNPLAPSIISQDIYDRWRNRIPNGQTDRAFVNGTAEAALFQLNQQVTKNIGAYWEVNLDNISSDDLQQFDVVLIPLHGGRSTNGQALFSPAERERLRRFVDAGGTVWLENAGEGTNAVGAESFFEWLNTGAGPAANSNVSVLAGHHPLVNYPYLINQQDAFNLGSYNPTAAAFINGTGAAASARTLAQSAQPIIQRGNATTVWASDYGAGHVLVTSATIGGDINNYLLGGSPNGNSGSSVIGANDGAVSGDNLGGIPAADMKLAYNLANWISSVPTPGSNQRRTGATPENIGGILTPKWSPIPITGSNPIESATVRNPGSGATIYKGVAFWVDGNNWFHAYDVNPQQSLSGNNLPDDGISDLLYGSSYDQVYNDQGATLPGAGAAWASTPTIIAQNIGGTVNEVAVVTTTDGSTYFYNALPRNGGVLASSASMAIKNPLTSSNADMRPGLTPGNGNGGTPAPNAGLPYTQQSPSPTPAPAYSDGILFTLVFTNPLGTAGELGWRIAPVDLQASIVNGDHAVSVFNNNQPANQQHQLAPSADFTGGVPGFYTPTGSLTVGEVRSLESDALDRIVFVPVLPDAVATQPSAGAVRAVWFSTRNEPLDQDLTDTTGATYMPKGLRAHVPWFTNPGNNMTTLNLLPVVHLIQHSAAGGPITGLGTYYLGTDFDVSYQLDTGSATGNHSVRVIFKTLKPGPLDDVRVDYTVDWPGDVVGTVNSQAPSIADMNTFMQARGFPLFTPNPQQNLPETTGGLTLSTLDNLLFSVSNLHDGSVSGGLGGTPPIEDRVFCVRDQYVSQAPTTTGTAVPVAPRRAAPLVNWMFSPAPARAFDQAYANNIFQGYQTQNRLTYNKRPISNFKAIGQPVSYNGTVYVLGQGFVASAGAPDVTVLLALRENVDTTLDLGPIDATANITLLQPSILDAQRPISLRQDIDFSVERVQDPTTGSYKGIAHIGNFQAGTNDVINLALPIWVQASVGQQPASVTPLVNRATGFGPLDNLQYYVVIPTQLPTDGFGQRNTDASGNYLPDGLTATSGPSISGSTLYFAADKGFRNGGKIPSTVVSVDLTAAAAQSGSYEDNQGKFLATIPKDNVYTDVTNVNVSTELATEFPSINPPLGTTNVMLAPNAQSVVGLDNGLLLIADSHRLLEIDAGGNASWSLDSTVSESPIGGNTAATAGIGLKPVALSHPSTATRYALNEFLVADSGNNRIVGTNRGGTVRFEVSGFSDALRLLQPGSPLSFNQPTDVENFTENYPNGYSVLNRDLNVTFSYGGACTVVHYLVADSGNYRIVDIVDIYDANGNIVGSNGNGSISGTLPDGTVINASGSKLLVFVTRSLAEQNQRLRYRTVQQFRLNGADYIVSTVGNVRQGNAGGVGVVGNDDTNFEGPGGSLVVVQRNPGVQAGNAVSLVNSFVITDVNGAVVRRQTVSNPTWFKEYSVFDPTGATAQNKQAPRFLLADANGCYVLRLATIGGVNEYVADWILAADDYFYMTGRRLQATCIQRETVSDLSSRNLFESRFLITNGYTGIDNIPQVFGAGGAGVVNGEVFEVRSSDYYSSSAPNPNYNNSILYNGYQVAAHRLYVASGGNLFSNIIKDPTGNLAATGNSSIRRMIPNELLSTFSGNGTVQNATAGRGLKRTIGSADNSLTTYLLQQPQYAEHPL